MARRTRSTSLADRTNRLKLPVAKKPVFVRIGPGVSLGYRRNVTTGTWVVRAVDDAGKTWTDAFAHADDFEDANGSTVLTYWNAQDKARDKARSGRNGDGDDGKPLTVDGALDRYEADLKARGGDVSNVVRVRGTLKEQGDGKVMRTGGHLPEALARKQVVELSKRDLEQWRNGLGKGMAPASVNRVCTALRAALNLYAAGNASVTNSAAWELGLKAIPDATETRNVILDKGQIVRVVAEAREESAEFGLLVEVAAETGARVSQLARITVGDMKADPPAIAMPSSRKGRGRKKVLHRQSPIPPALYERLRAICKDKPADAILLTKPSGEPWKKSDQTRPFRRAAKRAGLDANEVTINALRHSSIMRALKAGAPIRAVAAVHDTSVAMIEKTYSVSIDKHVDEILRPTLLDLSPRRRAHKSGGKIVQFRRHKAATTI